MRTNVEKLLRWFIFSVAVAMIPLALTYFVLEIERQNPTLEDVLSNGELLLISTAIAAAAIGEVIGTTPKRAVLKILATGVCTITAMLGSVFYTIIRTAAAPDPRPIMTVSLLVFGGTILASAGCMYLAHEEER